MARQLTFIYEGKKYQRQIRIDSLGDEFIIFKNKNYPVAALIANQKVRRLK